MISLAELVDFFDIKGDIETLLPKGECWFVTSDHPSLHPGQSADIMLDNRKIGIVGQLHPKRHIELDASEPLFYFELELSAISQVKLPKFNSLSKFPSIRRDLALLVEKNLPAQALLDCIKQAAGSLLVDATLFDIYVDEKLGNLKSVAVSLLWQDLTKTMVEAEINQLTDNVLQSLRQQFNAVLRE